MSKIRQPGFPDGTVWIRTHPVTYLHDFVDAEQTHAWHQLTFAVRGHVEVETDELRAIVPPDSAIWLPAGMSHAERMHAPVSVRTLYVAPGCMADQPSCRTVAVSPLLRELIVHITGLGALDNRELRHSRLIGVLLDQLDALRDVPLQLPTPKDPRARRLVGLMEDARDEAVSIAQLASRAGASLRTIERLFMRDTGMSVGDWRRRFRLFRALRLLDDGATVSNVAFEVGYSTVSAFSAAFHRQFGAPPSKHRLG